MSNSPKFSLMEKLKSVAIKIWNHPVLIATALYTIFTVIITYPVAWNLTSGLAGNSGDSYQHLWSLWWGEKAFFDLHTTLANISTLYYPQEITHPILWVTPWIQIVASPLVHFFGPVTAYNIGFLLSTILTGTTTYLLTYEITQKRLAAFIGGLVYAFAPTRFIHGLGHYAQIMTYLFPLYLYFLYRFLKKPSWKLSVLTGITLAAASLVNFLHLAYFVIPATLILVGYNAWSDWRGFWPKRFWGLAVAAVIALILTSPFFVPFLRAQSESGLDYLSSAGTSRYSADLLAFITPSPRHPLVKNFPEIRLALERITAVGYDRRNVAEGLIYLGILPIILAVIGIIKRRNEAWPWFLLLLFTAILSLGPVLKFNGELVSYSIDDIVSYFVLPYALLTKLPLYELARTPGRINVTTMLALAVLVSLGVAVIETKMERRLLPPLVLGFVIIPIVLLEYLVVWPYPVTDTSTPVFYEEVANEFGEFAILDYPMFLHKNWSAHNFDLPMFYQLTHERPIAGGYIWRIPAGVEGTMLLLDNLASSSTWVDIVPTPPLDKRASSLAQLGFRYVVLHKYDTASGKKPLPEDELFEATAHLTSLLGEPVYDDDKITAFLVPPSSFESNPPLIALGENWDRREEELDVMWRWTLGDESDLWVSGISDMPYQLTFTVDSIGGPRRMEILVNGESLGETVVHESRQITTPPFLLPLAQNQIVFEVREACELLDEESVPSQKNPCRNLRFSDIVIAPEQIHQSQYITECAFEEEMKLLGYDMLETAVSPGEELQFTLYWQANQLIEKPYTVFAHLLDEKGQLQAQQDNYPMNGQYPTNWWMPGEIITDHYKITIPENTPPGSYTLTTGLYFEPTGERLSIGASCSKASANQNIQLAPITINDIP